MTPPTPPDIAIAAGTEADLPVVARLADAIWRAHYPGIVAQEQIDYMLARGYAVGALAKFVEAPGAGLAIARAGGERVGFAAWYRPDESATTKLDKLYALPSRHGRGVGRALIAHVEAAARRDGARTLVLDVNKHNATAIVAYRACGFSTRESIVADIGGGFVMDDYVMAKGL
jgi:ribosomal protein S18 acetylase RimI-like enzyme